MVYPRFVHQPRLKLTSPPHPTGTANRLHTDTSAAEHATLAAIRLVDRLQIWTRKTAATRPIRVLDYSGNNAAIATQAVELGAQARIEIEVFIITDSAVAAELLGDQLADSPNITALQDTLQSLSALGKPNTYDCVHTALTLASRRELPMLTALGKLQRLTAAGFVWTDRVDHSPPMNKKRAIDILSRVDLGFCSFKKSLRSKLFTCAGLRQGVSIT